MRREQYLFCVIGDSLIVGWSGATAFVLASEASFGAFFRAVVFFLLSVIYAFHLASVIRRHLPPKPISQ